MTFFGIVCCDVDDSGIDGSDMDGGIWVANVSSMTKNDNSLAASELPAFIVYFPMAKSSEPS